MLGVLKGRWHPVDPALEPPDPEPGVTVEDAAEDVLGEGVAERRHGLEHPDRDGVELVRRRGRVLTDVMRDRDLRLLDRLPDAVHRGARVVDRALLQVLARRERHEERLQPERLQLVHRPASSLRVPPVDQTDAEDAVVRPLLDLRDVLVVDPEAELPDLPVRPPEQGENGVRERQLLGDALRLERRQPRVDVARVRPGDGVVLREHLDELGHEDGLPVHSDHPPTTDVHDPGRAVLHAVGKALVEDVLRQRDVVVGREHLGPRREPEVDDRARTAILRRAQTLGRVRQRPRRYRSSPPLHCSTDDDRLLRRRSNRQRTLLACSFEADAGRRGGQRGRDMTTWDSTVDLVIVGSGGGGMVAALTAADAGASALVLEKQERVGGSTAMSGGIVWVPNNPVMRADGVPDSYEDAMAHFEAVVGDVGPASSFERRHAFLTAGPEMVSFLQERGVRFVYCPGYSDYYSSAKGGHDNRTRDRARSVRRSSAR